ncbi:MAG: 3-hydroxybutyryl-CoA dehydrogenase [Bacteroidetes bacterium]|nr:3-hydroxybutyryl-CoA dehydrogenase [Bacteroidota bacterium]
MAKQLDQINSIAVIGSGTMGAAIAQVVAMTGYEVKIYDIEDKALDKAHLIIEANLDKGIERGKVTEEEKTETLIKMRFTSNFDELEADIIVEAIVERLDVKVDLFQRLAEINNSDTIFASNTSSIPITRIAAGTPNPERVVGMHFFNPAHIMKLVEVISSVATDPEVAKTVFQLAEKMGKQAVMAADAPGFIVNRVARHFYVEGLRILEEGVADHATIDELIESYGFKMGPYRLMDLIGVDSNFLVTSSMFESFHYDSKFRPSRIQQKKIEAGHYGKKSGKGWYDYQ